MCGREFIPSSPSERYCPGVCAMSARATECGRKEEGYVLAKGKYPRVDAMFKLPVSERWAIASTFTKEEQAYSLRVQKRMLFMENRSEALFDEEMDFVRDSIGESDDGTV